VRTTDRAVAAALAVGRAHGLSAETPEVVRDATNVLVHLAPAPVIARVSITFARLRGPEWFAEEMRVARFLADAGAPIAPPADVADPGPHQQDGFHVTLWRLIDHDEARLDAAAAGRSLRELHSAIARYPHTLPTCDRLDEVQRLLATFEQTDEIAELRSLAQRLRPLPGRPIHGDAHLRNVLWSPEGPLWTDLENVCQGPIEFDLACLRYRPSPERDAAIRAYGDHDGAVLEAAHPYVTLFIASWTLVVAERVDSPTADEEAHRRVERALAYAREM
jgi:hypothetical protein